MNRRQLLGAMGVMAAGGVLLPLAASAQKGGKSGVPFFNVKDFGATGDGITLDTAAVNQAIDACTAAGGGLVYLPPGTYLSGTVVLKSNVTLYLEAGATLLGSKKLADYSAQPGPPAQADANQKHLVFARDAENVGLAGPGKIDGQGPSFWVPSGRPTPPAENDWQDVATYDWKPLARPSPMIEFCNCKNLRIEDVRIENSAGWTMRPINCDNVYIHGIRIKNPIIGPNADGIDLTCSQNVFISDCLIETADDAICLKSESPYGGEPRVSKNITITNCILTSCCNGLKIGTATRGGFENIVFSNSVIFNEDVNFKQRVIAGLALEMVDGGWIDGILISNIRMQRVRTPIFIRRGVRHAGRDGTPGKVRGIMIENVHATGSILTSSITGLPGFRVEDVTLSNLRIDSDEGGPAEWADEKVKENEKSYPEARMFGRLPAGGLYCRHVEGLRLRDIDFRGTPKEARPTIICDDVQSVEIDGLKGTPIDGSQPVVKLIQTKQAFVHNCWPPAGAKTFLEVQGDQSAQIVLMNNNLTGVETAVQTGPDVPANAVINKQI